MTSEITVLDGETAEDAARRLGKRPGESWEALRVRLERADALRQDGGDDDGLGPSDASASRATMLKAKGCAPAEDAEPDAAKAQKDFLAKRTGKAPKRLSSTEVPAKPPVSESEAEEEGDDDEEGEDEEFDAAKAKAASDARKIGGKR